MQVETDRFDEQDGSYFHYTGTEYVFREGPRRYTVRRHDQTPIEASFIRYEEKSGTSWKAVSLDEFPGFDPLVNQVIGILMECEVYVVNFLREDLDAYEPVDVQAHVLDAVA